MTLETKDNLGHGGTGFHGTGKGSAAAMIRELQAQKSGVADGALPATNITLTGVKANDTLVSVIHFEAGAPTADMVAEASITADDTIQLSTTDTTGDKLVVTWLAKPAGL